MEIQQETGHVWCWFILHCALLLGLSRNASFSKITKESLGTRETWSWGKQGRSCDSIPTANTAQSHCDRLGKKSTRTTRHSRLCSKCLKKLLFICVPTLLHCKFRLLFLIPKSRGQFALTKNSNKTELLREFDGLVQVFLFSVWKKRWSRSELWHARNCRTEKQQTVQTGAAQSFDTGPSWVLHSPQRITLILPVVLFHCVLIQYKTCKNIFFKKRRFSDKLILDVDTHSARKTKYNQCVKIQVFAY